MADVSRTVKTYVPYPSARERMTSALAGDLTNIPFVPAEGQSLGLAPYIVARPGRRRDRENGAAGRRECRGGLRRTEIRPDQKRGVLRAEMNRVLPRGV